jgi:putative polyhydroxyalkanoate system protein
MAKVVQVNIPHRLGREEAKKRIDAGLGKLLEPLSSVVQIERNAWTGDRLEFTASAMGQSVPGSIDVEDAKVRVTLELPWLLASLADKAKAVIEQRTGLMLEDKSRKT